VKEIGGHGIGRKFHDEPFVPAWGKRGKGDKLVPWQCITVEPMVNQGTDQYVERSIPGSSIMYYETADGLLSAQFEHTILVTDKGYEILTVP
jgi:methionyl aminopeptidase